MKISNYSKTKQIVFLVISLLAWSISLSLFFMNNDAIIVDIILVSIILTLVIINYYYSKMYNISIEKNCIYIENIYRKKAHSFTDFDFIDSTGTIKVYSVFYYLSPPLFYLKTIKGEKIYFERNSAKYSDLLLPFNGTKVADELSKEITRIINNSSGTI